MFQVYLTILAKMASKLLITIVRIYDYEDMLLITVKVTQ